MDNAGAVTSPTGEEYAAAMRELSRVGWARLRREFRETINRWEGRA